MASVSIKDNSKQVLSDYGKARESSLEIIGMEAERFAKEELSRPKPHKDGTNRPNVITGLLRNETTHKVQDREVYVGTNTEYAPEVELGTINSPAYPFLVPAATQHTPHYKNIIESEYAKINK